MKNLMKKKLLPLAVALVTGVGVSTSVQAVHVAEDGVGQLLLAPYYTTLDGQVTKVAIYNTSEVHAVKAKVSIRSMAHSIEVRDFICYLTPADVCRFEIMSEGGKAYLTSTDDSVRSLSGKFASEDPLKIELDTTQMLQVDKNDTALWGHFEVHGVYAYLNGGPAGNGRVQREMSKYNLAAVFDNPRPFNTFDVSNNPELLRISGDVVVENAAGQLLGYKIPALAGNLGDNTVDLAGNPIYDPNTGMQFDGRVIANAAYDATGTRTTPIAIGFGAGGTDNIYELEYALASTRIKGTYETGGAYSADTRVLVTFPTKYRHRGVYTCGGSRAPLNPAYYTAPFNTPDGSVDIEFFMFDNSERRSAQGYFSPSSVGKLYAEVNNFKPDSGWTYQSGYYDMHFLSRGCVSLDGRHAYDGMPVLAMTYKMNSANGLLIQSSYDRTAARNSW